MITQLMNLVLKTKLETIGNRTAFRLIWSNLKAKIKSFLKRIRVFCTLMLVQRTSIRSKLKELQETIAPKEQAEREKDSAVLMNKNSI